MPQMYPMSWVFIYLFVMFSWFLVILSLLGFVNYLVLGESGGEESGVFYSWVW